MKLLFDENLSPLLVEMLADVFPESSHVHRCGLGSSSDAAIWEYAKTNGYSIVTKDSDFAERSVLLGVPPKVIWIRLPNCPSSEIAHLLFIASSAIAQFAGKEQETCCLVLS